MSDLAEDYKAWNEAKKEKRWDNYEKSANYLIENKIEFEELSDCHLRVSNTFDFWPTTGLFINIKTKKRGRGLFNLIKELNKK